VYEDHHRVGAGPPRKPQVGTLRAIRSIAVDFSSREEIEDQAPGSHCPGILEPVPSG